MSLRVKLFIALMTCSLVMFLFITRAVQSTYNIRESTTHIQEDISPAIWMTNGIRSELFHLVEGYSTIAFFNNSNLKNKETLLNRELDQVIQNEINLSHLIRKLTSLLRQDPVSDSHLDSFKLIFESLTSDYKSFVSGKINFLDFKEKLENYESKIDQLTSTAVQYQLELLKATGDTIEKRLNKSKNLILVSATTALAISSIFALFFSFTFLKPIYKLKNDTANIASGNYDIKLTLNNSSELGLLESALHDMSQKIKATTVSNYALSQILDSINSIVLVLNEMGQIRKINQMAMLLLGFEEKDLLGMHASILFQAQEDAKSITLNTINNQVFKIKRKNGESLSALINLSQIESPKNNEFNYVLLATDLTSKLELENEIQMMRGRLSIAEKLASTGRIAATVSHRLNQPLAAIRLFLQQCIRSINTSNDSVNIIQNLETSISQIDRAKNIVSEILVSTRNDKKVEMSEINLHKLALTITEVARINNSNSKLIVNSENLKSLRNFKTELSDLEEIFYILIENAMHASACKNASLNISGEISGSVLRLSFQDNCGGFQQELLESMFCPFSTSKEIGQGTGLGLYILKEIVEKHGGSVDLVNNQGIGAVFNISINESGRQVDSYRENQEHKGLA